MRDGGYCCKVEAERVSRKTRGGVCDAAAHQLVEILQTQRDRLEFACDVLRTHRALA